MYDILYILFYKSHIYIYAKIKVHIPTFVNFLREIETCDEIEDYVVNSLGDSKLAKSFAQQFYLNRESQVKHTKKLTNNIGGVVK